MSKVHSRPLVEINGAYTNTTSCTAVMNCFWDIIFLANVTHFSSVTTVKSGGPRMIYCLSAKMFFLIILYLERFAVAETSWQSLKVIYSGVLQWAVKWLPISVPTNYVVMFPNQEFIERRFEPFFFHFTCNSGNNSSHMTSEHFNKCCGYICCILSAQCNAWQWTSLFVCRCVFATLRNREMKCSISLLGHSVFIGSLPNLEYLSPDKFSRSRHRAYFTVM